MKFKNIRQPARATKAGIAVEPQAKKPKITDVSDDDDNNTNGEEYDKNVQYLKKLWNSKKWSLPVILQLVEQTATGRRKWIVEDCPAVSELLDCFPCFADPRIMSLVVIAFACVIDSISSGRRTGNNHWICSNHLRPGSLVT